MGPYRYDSPIMGGHDARPVVVLADDDEAITSNLAPFLDRAGFTVHIAPDGEAALDLVERLDPDGCILDVLMPRADGREVLRRLRAAGRWLPVVLLTQVGESGERAIALDEGADDYLNKPFDPYELLARLRAVRRRARPGRRPLSASPAACPGPASGWRWCASSPPGTKGGWRSAAGRARARWSASGSRHPAVPGPRPLSQVCDSTAIRPARRLARFLMANETRRRKDP
jgi:CheY-like chemotaxis protein